MYSEELRKKARAVAEELVWKLETLQHRARYDYKATPPVIRMLPTRIKRFANALPQDLVTLVIDELVAMAPYSGVVFNGDDEGDGIAYRPTNTYVKRDQTLGDAGRHRADHTYTIVQDLVLIEGDADMFDSVESSSCSRTVNVTRYWDEPDLPDCETGRQGVTYQVTDVSRDHDTDLFSYSVREVVALTQHVPAHVVECNDEFVRTVETWDNVYGSPGNYRFNDEDGDPGAEIGIPEPCGSATGETLQVTVSENEDCTFRIQVTRTVSKLHASAEFSIYRDQFVVKSSATDKNSPTPLDRSGVSYAGGVKTTYDSKANQDGTFDNRVAVETELPVSDAVVETRKSIRGITVSVTHRNQPSAAPVESLAVGGSVRNERTEGGLFNQTIVTPSNESVGQIRFTCAKTAFLHDHSSVENVATKPDSQDVAAATGGVVLTRQVSMTDEGTFDVTTDTKTEIPVHRAVVERRRTLRGIVVTTVNRSQSSEAALPAGIGSSVRNELTDGGLYNQTITESSPEPVGKIRTGCQRTLFWHEHSKTVNQKDLPSEEISFPGGGTTVQRSVTATDEGTFDVTDSTRTEQPVSKAVTETRVTLRGVLNTVMHRNQPTPADAPTRLGSSVRNERTDGGLYNQTLTTVSAQSVGLIAESCSRTAFEHQDSTTVNQATGSDGHVVDAGGGVTRQRQSRATDEGTYDVTEVRTEELAREGAVVEKHRTTHGTVTTTTNKAMRDVREPDLSVGDSFTRTLTPGMCHDTVHRVVSITADDFRKWDAEVSLNRYYQYTVWFENASEEQYKDIISEVESKAKDKLSAWEKDERAPGNAHVSPEVRHTEVDLYDGHVTFTATWGPLAAGQEGKKNVIFCDHAASTTETVPRILSAGKNSKIETTQRTHHSYLCQGRGFKALHATMSSLPILGTLSDSFSINASDLTWSFSRTQASNPTVKITGGE